MGNKILKEIRPKAIVVVSSHWETMDEIRVGKFEGETPIIYNFQKNYTDKNIIAKRLSIVQVSLTQHAYNIKFGRALAPLRDEGILFIGSGMMVHNLHDSVNRETKAVLQEVLPYTIPFERNLDKIVIDSKVPIHVAAGAAGQDQGKKIYESFFGGLSWGSVEFCDGG
ncbi:17765_t:CDS:2 [Gigaspora rosea]|nr:17765_t:CDS:2 [Gigaspora rosea]